MAKPSRSDERMAPPQGGAVVRMYCTGLGDCFLLAFRAEHRKTSYVLIDCGVWKGTPGATSWMQRIMQDIRDEVGEDGLDLVVATHAHWDHLSGFAQAKDIFAALPVRQVWLPWTEDPEDRTAVRLAEDRRVALRAAVAAVGRLRGMQPADQVEAVEAVLKFSGFTPDGDERAAREDDELRGLGFGASWLGAGPSTDDLLEIVRGKVPRPRYLRPSLEPITLDNVASLRIYALGPPTDPKHLGKDDPSTVPGRSEVYLSPGMPLSDEAALFAAAYDPADPTPEDQERRDQTNPFDPWQRKMKDDLVHGAFFHARYFDPSNPELEWRRIDTDWLEAAGQLALNLDDHVNNTSLALAFELGEGGPVLLFPGDAQVGNWLSWHQLAGTAEVTAASLLQRTVLYKVGHHASHNATLKDQGLKLMTNASRLVAMIPVDESEARKPKGRNKDGWAMPYDKLLADLILRTEGRVLRADREPQEPAAGEVPGWNDETRERWRRFRENLVVRKVHVDGVKARKTLYFQHTVRP